MIAYLWLSFVLGLFFAISGWRKVAVDSTHSKVFSLFAKYNVPLAAGWAVVLGEWLGGGALLLPHLSLLLSGLLFPLAMALSAIAAFLLLPIMAGAIKLSVMPTLRRSWQASGAGFFQKVANFICTAEVMMAASLVALVLLYLF